MNALPTEAQLNQLNYSVVGSAVFKTPICATAILPHPISLHGGFH